jgi:hypothetical protein
MAAGEPALLQVLLVVLFGGIVGGGGGDLGNDRPAILAAHLQASLRCHGGVALLRAVVEDGGAVLGADIPPLAIQGGRVVVLPEDLKELLVADPGRIIYDLDRFRVPGPTGADLVIRGAFEGPTEVEITPLIWRNAASTPQKQPAANVALAAGVVVSVAFSTVPVISTLFLLSIVYS